MTTRTSDVPPRRGRSRPRAPSGVVLVAALIAAVVVLSPAASASTYRSGNPISWSNGVVLCQFAAGSPSVAVSHSGVSGTGVTIALLSLVEVASGTSVVRVANLSGLTWVVENRSTDDWYDLAYSAHAPLVSPSGGGGPVGSVDLLVQFVLPIYQESPQLPTNQVSVLLSIGNWTWTSPNDQLELAFGVAPSFPASEHLNATSAPGWLLASSSNESGQVLEQVGTNSTAEVTSGAGSPATVIADASLEIPSPSWAELSVTFGNSAGAFSSLLFGAHVGVVIPATVAGIPISELAAVATAAALVSLAVAAVTRRIRRRPSKLIYVSGEKEP